MATNPSGHKTTERGENEWIEKNIEKYGFVKTYSKSDVSSKDFYFKYRKDGDKPENYLELLQCDDNFTLEDIKGETRRVIFYRYFINTPEYLEYLMTQSVGY